MAPIFIGDRPDFGNGISAGAKLGGISDGIPDFHFMEIPKIAVAGPAVVPGKPDVPIPVRGVLKMGDAFFHAGHVVAGIIGVHR